MSREDEGYLAKPTWQVRLDQIADSIADGIVVSDEECRIVHANPAAERMFGLNLDQLLGRTCDDPAWSLTCGGRPLDRSELACYRALTSGKTLRSAERQLKRADGTCLTVLVSASPLRDEQGCVVGVVNSLTDITALKQAQDSIRESDEYARALLETYARLGIANTYRSILEAVQPEITRTIGYHSVWLQLVWKDGAELLTMYAGGRAEQSMRDLMDMDERLTARVGEDLFLTLPLTADPYLRRILTLEHVDVLDDAQTDPITNQPENKELVRTSGNRTIVAVPLMLAEEKLGTLAMGTFFDEGVLVPNQRQLEWLTLLANHVAVATDRVRFLGERREAETALAQSLDEAETALNGVVQALSSTTSERDPYTGLHQQRVARLACAIAEEMELDEATAEVIRIAGVLHDIGKISVPVEILAKPCGLSEMEFGLIRSHSEVGHRLLADVPFRAPVAKIVLQHHERLDGSGYPNGLLAEDILLEARILAVADVVEAMASDRPYRPARGVPAALEEIRCNAGTKFDRDVVDACVSVLAKQGSTVA